MAFLLIPFAAVLPGAWVMNTFLAAIGFDIGIGAAAGGLAAWFQSVFGTNILFNYLLSASMGGVAAVVNAINGFFGARVVGAAWAWAAHNGTAV